MNTLHSKLRSKIEAADIPLAEIPGLLFIRNGNFYVSSGKNAIVVGHNGKSLHMLEADDTVAKYAGSEWFSVKDIEEVEAIKEGVSWHVSEALKVAEKGKKG